MRWWPAGMSGRELRPAAGEQLADLDGVGGRALAQVVDAEEEGERPGAADVGTDPADEHVVLAGRVARRRIALPSRVVDDAHPGGGGEQLAGGVGANRLGELHPDRGTVPGGDGDAHGGD